MDTKRKLVEVKDLSKVFRLSRKQRNLINREKGEKIAVNSINFDVYEGEIFGLLGPNGAGKTTTLRMLSTLVVPTNGEAFIDGISITKNPVDVRKHIGFLTSELKLEDYFTPNYLFNYFAELYFINKESAEIRKKELFEKFGIDKFSETKIGELSTGMKQKVSLIISIIHDPQLIIFDEPTNGLDIVAAKVVTDFLLELKKCGKTIIVSTHIFELIEKICDRVGIIVDGDMVLCKELSEIKTNGRLEDLFFELYNERDAI